MTTAHVKFLGPQPNQPRNPQAGFVGTGRLEFDGDRVRLVAKRGKKLVPGLVAGVVFVAGMLGGILLMMALHLDGGRSGMKLTAVVGLLTGTLPAAGIYSLLLAKLPGVPVDTAVARDALQTVHGTAARIDLHAPALGHFAIQPLDPASAAVLAEQFTLAQKL